MEINQDVADAFKAYGSTTPEALAATEMVRGQQVDDLTTSLTAVRRAHEFTTRSESHHNSGLVTRVAGCTCGVEHEWFTRTDDHALHADRVMAVTAIEFLNRKD